MSTPITNREIWELSDDEQVELCESIENDATIEQAKHIIANTCFIKTGTAEQLFNKLDAFQQKYSPPSIKHVWRFFKPIDRFVIRTSICNLVQNESQDAQEWIHTQAERLFD